MTERIAETSPRFKARIAGFFYLLTFLTALPILFLSGRLVVAGDAAATAANILAHEAAFQLGVAAYVLNVVVYITVTLLFYDLFKPVNPSLSLLAVFFSLVGCAVDATACVFEIVPLIVLEDSHYLSAFKLEQLQAVAYMFSTCMLSPSTSAWCFLAAIVY